MSTRSVSSTLFRVLCVFLLQGEEGPPSLEYIQARDLFPQKDLVKEDDTLQVSSLVGLLTGYRDTQVVSQDIHLQGEM